MNLQIEPPKRSYRTDVVIVGNDSAALLAAIRARNIGLEVTLLHSFAGHGEGLLWIPQDYASARNYLDQVLGSATSEQAAQRHALLQTAAKLPQVFEELEIRLSETKIPDHYPSLPDATTGRVYRAGYKEMFVNLSAKFFDSDPLDVLLSSKAAEKEATIWGIDGLLDLVWRDGRVVGVTAKREGETVLIEASFGVIFADGGFGSNPKLRRQYLPGTRAEQQISEDDGGQVLEVALGHGIDHGSMRFIWKTVGMQDPVSSQWVDATEAVRAPHSLLVDASGKRFCAESEPTEQIANRLGGRSAWLILDSKHRRSVALGALEPGRVARRVLESGLLRKAKTFGELAELIHVDAQTLEETVERFNQLAKSGVDEDFCRDWRANAKTSVARAAISALGSLRRFGQLEKAPFYAIEIRACDLATKGGLLVDGWRRALRDGKPVEGLYAIGSAAASITDERSPGPGFRTTEALCGALQIDFG